MLSIQFFVYFALYTVLCSFSTSFNIFIGYVIAKWLFSFWKLSATNLPILQFSYLNEFEFDLRNGILERLFVSNIGIRIRLPKIQTEPKKKCKMLDLKVIELPQNGIFFFIFEFPKLPIDNIIATAHQPKTHY